MTAVILDGRATAKTIKAELAQQVITLKEKGITPGLGTLLVGDDPGSHSYVAGKHRDCAEVGVHSIRIDLPQNASQADVRAAIRDLNEAKDVTGYIIQLPLPFGFDTNAIFMFLTSLVSAIPKSVICTAGTIKISMRILTSLSVCVSSFFIKLTIVKLTLYIILIPGLS